MKIKKIPKTKNQNPNNKTRFQQNINKWNFEKKNILNNSFKINEPWEQQKKNLLFFFGPVINRIDGDISATIFFFLKKNTYHEPLQVLFFLSICGMEYILCVCWCVQENVRPYIPWLSFVCMVMVSSLVDSILPIHAHLYLHILFSLFWFWKP